MAKSLLKKAKKAAKSVKKEVKSASSSTESSLLGYENLRDHLKSFSTERRDCSVIWTVIKDDESYNNREKIIALIKAKGYETLLGEIS